MHSVARDWRSKPLGVACAACLERLARRFRQPRCVHISPHKTRDT